MVHHAVHHAAKKVDLSSVVPLLAKIARLLYHRTLARALEGFTIGMREEMRTVALYEALRILSPFLRAQTHMRPDPPAIAGKAAAR